MDFKAKFSFVSKNVRFSAEKHFDGSVNPPRLHQKGFRLIKLAERKYFFSWQICEYFEKDLLFIIFTLKSGPQISTKFGTKMHYRVGVRIMF